MHPFFISLLLICLFFQINIVSSLRVAGKIHYPIKSSTTISPNKPKISPGKTKSFPSPSFNPAEIFRSDDDKQLNDKMENNNYIVILYNDPFNKRLYVQQTLIEVFNWDEAKANSIMMQVIDL